MITVKMVNVSNMNVSSFDNLALCKSLVPLYALGTQLQHKFTIPFHQCVCLPCQISHVGLLLQVGGCYTSQLPLVGLQTLTLSRIDVILQLVHL